MIDPLNKEISFYEILGVEINAGKEEIEIAFKKALGSRKYTPQQIANARKQLLDTESRLETDFFLYSKEQEHEICFEQLTKGCMKSVEKLEFEIRPYFDKLDLEFLEEGDE